MIYEEKDELEVLNKKIKRKLKGIAIIVVIFLVVVGGIFLKGYLSAKKNYEDRISELEAENEKLSDPLVKYEIASKEVSIDLIESKLKSIGEFVTMEYLYTDAGKFEDPKQLFGIDIPFTTKTFTIKCDGIIKAGVKIDKIVVKIEKTKKEVIIYLPETEIISHEIEEDSIETLEEKDGLFNPVKIDDIREFDTTLKKAMEERAIENGLLEDALENAKQVIEKLVNNDVIQEQGYKIKFKKLK